MASKAKKRNGRPNSFPVVGIGSSAGGVGALQAFFKAMPAGSGMAFIAVPHLDPTAPSHMVEVLSSQTGMPVEQADEGVRLRPDRVYVIPPNRYLTVADETLHLAVPGDPRGHRRPIDLFFHSLGRDLRERAIAIILSGTGTNGASGLRTIKGEGGFVLVQKPETAQYAGMPEAAIRTGLVDEVMAPEEMPEALVRLSRHPYMRAAPDEPATQGELVDRLLAIVRTRTRHDFRSYKRGTIARRIQRRMGLHGMHKLGDYVELVRRDAEEAKALVRDFMISVSGFFRDPPAWKALDELVVRPLVREREADGPLRVWVPGCATGEEAYSIGMLLVEAMEAAGKRFDLKIFATDTTLEGLEFARNGLYPASIGAEISPERLARFFISEHEAWRVKPALRNLVTFATQNVLQDPPFTRLDLVSCRNLLIYLEPDVQKKLLALFHFALGEQGCLFLGTAETTSTHEDLFQSISKKWRIYRRAGGTRRDLVEFPVLGGRYRPEDVQAPDVAQARPRPRVAEVARDALLAEYAPAAVVIDRRYKVQYFHGDTDPFLRQPGGEPTTDLLQLARDGLRAKIRAVVEEAAKDGAAVATRLRIGRPGAYRQIRLAAQPMAAGRSADGLLLVTFQGEPGRAAAPAEAPAAAAAEHPEAETLEQENRALREELNSTIEQMESSNEELKASNEEILSMNEELQSANEELETSKEELQSFNEELNTVNAQLQAKVEELEERTNDLNNLLNSTSVATLFLDRDQRIRWFTPAMRELIELIPTDIGRPAANLAHGFAEGAVADDAAKVLETLAPVRREVRTKRDRWFLRQTQPYRTSDDRIDGVVITFTDITQNKRAEDDLRAERDFAESIVDTVRHPILVLDPDLLVVAANSAFCELFRVPREETEGRLVYDLGNRQWDIPALRKLLEDVLPDDEVFEDYEVRHAFPELGERVMLLNARRLDSVQLILLAIEDMTERERVQRQRELLVAELNHRVKNSLMAVQSITTQTLRSATSMEDFRERLQGRLQALARCHDLLVQGHWESQPLQALLETVVAPYDGTRTRRVAVKCADIQVTPRAAVPLVMAINELATNAVKYGALSGRRGRIEVACTRRRGRVRLVWRERDGPRIDGPPEEPGFGTRLIEMTARHDLDGTARLDYRPDGLVCTLELPETAIVPTPGSGAGGTG